MNSFFSAPQHEIHIIAKLADIKEEHYHQLVTLSAMLELLIDKGIFTREEVEKKVSALDAFIDPPPYPMV